MINNMTKEELNELSLDIINGKKLSDDELRELLEIQDTEQLEKLYSVARSVRDHFFGNKVFMYSFVYFSTHCKNKCTFCYYRTSHEISRYRLNMEEIRSICRGLKGESIHMVDLTMGEDPYFHDEPERFIDIVRTVRSELDLPIMISPRKVS